MAFSPISKVYLCDTPLDNTYQNQIYFSSLTKQLEYFLDATTIEHTVTNVSMVRKESKTGFKINKYIDEVMDSNYIVFQNPNYSNKWFFAYITDFEYVNPEVTNIYYEIDVYQTWLEECTLKESFVIREHVMDDTIGLNIVEEGLETGQFKMRDKVHPDELSDISYVVAVSDLTPTGSSTSIGHKYSNVYSGLAYFAFDSTDISGINSFINDYISGTDARPDAIAFIFTIPTCFIPSSVSSGDKIPSGSSASGFNWTINGNFNDIDGYVPKNNKLFTYPYNYLYASNNQGGSAIYRYEDFNIYNYNTFAILGNIAPNPVLMLCPMNYKGLAGYNQEYGLSMGGYPLCSWNNDTFAAWLTQNYPNIGMGFIGSAVSTFVGGKSGNIGSGVMGALNQIAQMQTMAIQPDQARGNTNGGSLNIASDSQYFYISQMYIKKQYAEIIDQFFTMYGYKVNSVKVPNINGRPYWNFVQTNDVNIKGSIPVNDMKRLKQMYNDGVTFWKYPDTVGDYSYNNQIS